MMRHLPTHFTLLLLALASTLKLTTSSPSSSSSSTILVPLTDLSVPLFETKYSHHVHVYVGSPPQRRIVIVDTGSRVLVFPCEPCIHCGTNHVSKSYFDPKISSTDVRNDCYNCVFRKPASVSK